MAKFHVGQRVRILSSYAAPQSVGRSATIVGSSTFLSDHWHLNVDGLGRLLCPGSCFGEYGFRLAPLTDPSAERFIESIKRLGREPINDAPKVTVSK